METIIANPWLGFPRQFPRGRSLFEEIEQAWIEVIRRVRRLRATEARQVGSWPWFGLAEIDGQWVPDGRGAKGMRPQGNPDFDPHDEPEDEPQVAFKHDTVMKEEATRLLQPGPGKLFFDGTLGGGGHSEAILEAGANIVAMDQDPHAIRYAEKRLARFDERFCAIRGNFRHFPEILAETGVTGFDGMIVDLGVSSHQLDEPSRGFSFQNDGPLDLRMDPESPRSAADIVNMSSAEEIEQMLREFGEEQQARRIAQAIVRARAKKPLLTTAELADVIAATIGRKGKKHPATLTFQALRIAVNDELAALHQFLEAAPRWLKPGGRLVAISFHSLEDRIVKHAFQHLSAPMLDRIEWPEAKKNPDHCLALINRKPMEPTKEEVGRNPRSRSAKLRAAEKILS